MKQRARVLLVWAVGAIVAIGLSRCGARTELEAPTRGADGDAFDSGLDSDEDVINCSLHYGPVATCDGPGAPWILRCKPGSICWNQFTGRDDAGNPLWACCDDIINNVPGVCGYPDPDACGCPFCP